MMDYFVVDVAQSMFFSDSFQNARPMTYYVERPYDIDEQFNRVALSKGLFLLFCDHFLIPYNCLELPE